MEKNKTATVDSFGISFHQTSKTCDHKNIRLQREIPGMSRRKRVLTTHQNASGKKRFLKESRVSQEEDLFMLIRNVHFYNQMVVVVTGGLP